MKRLAAIRKSGIIMFGVIALATGVLNADEVKQQEALEGALTIKSQDAVVFVPVVAVTSHVAWAKSPIKIDGDLSDWKASGIEPISFDSAEHITWYGRDYEGPEDLSAKLLLILYYAFFYVAIEVKDGMVPAPNTVDIGIAPANSPLITTWRDVGKRYGLDDVHAGFSIGADGNVSLRWAHVQERMERELVSNAFGNEEERRAFIDQGDPDAAGAKIFSPRPRLMDGEKSTTFFEAAFPGACCCRMIRWRMVLLISTLLCATPIRVTLAVAV